jgi:hypothetical protein
MVAGILAFETGYGRSRAVRDYNNPAGLMAGGRGNRNFMKFDTIEEGISKAAEIQKKNYERGGETIAGMGALYAPVGAANDPGGTNKQWPSSVARLQAQMKGGGFAARAREEHLAAAMMEPPVGLMTTEGTARMPEIVRRARAREASQSPTAQRAPGLADEYPAEVSSAYPYLTDRLRIRPKEWERFLSETPKSTNIEDRRKDTADPYEGIDLPMREFDPTDRKSIDRGLANESGVEAKGNLDVNVKAPAGTEVRAEGDGMFKGNVTTNRQIDLPTLQ